ncbi:MAG: DUF4358 domain-containing protein [Lachnospiraceae bacterium]|nr:DUF4358 domain-containing protein [Lachnospiraceae bacterium]
MMKKDMIRRMLVVAAAGVLLAGCTKDKEEQSAAETQDITIEAEAESKEAESAEDQEKKADIEEIAGALRTEITYKDELSEIDLDTAAMIFSFGDAKIDKAVIYESTGATAEEIAVLECASGDDAKKAAQAFEMRVSEQKESFEDYVPGELNKLSDAVIVTRDNIVILSVSDEPEKAKEIAAR